MEKLFTPQDKDALIQLVRNDRVRLYDIDISGVFDLSDVFKNSKRTDFTGIENWDVTHVTNISNMFSGAQFFNADLSKWDLKSVSFEEKCFDYLVGRVFNQTPLVKELNQYNVNILDRNYFHCKLPLDKNIRYMCKGSCKAEELAYLCNNPNVELSQIDPSSATDFTDVLKDSKRSSYQGIENWITYNVKSFKNFAANAKNFDCVDIDRFDLSRAVTLEGFLQNTKYNFKFNFNISPHCQSMQNFCANCCNYNQDLDFLKQIKNSACNFSGMFVGTPGLKDHLNFPTKNPRLRDAISVSLLINNLNEREDLSYQSEDTEALYNVFTDELNNHLGFRTSLDNKNVIVCHYKEDEDLLRNYLKNNVKNGFFALDLMSVGSEDPNLKASSRGLYSCFLTNNTQLANFTNYVKELDPNYLDHVIPLKASDYIALKCFSIDHKIDFNFKAYQMLSQANKYFNRDESLLTSFNRTYELSMLNGDETAIYLATVFNKLAENGIIKGRSIKLDNKLVFNRDEKLIPAVKHKY